MKSFFQVAVVTAATAWCALPSTTAFAQVTPGFTNPKVVLLEGTKGDGGYWNTDSTGKNTPLRPESVQTRASMMKRKVLENYAEFLSPLRLPRTLRVIASDCNGNTWDSPHYSSNPRWMNICYSWAGDANQTMAFLAQNQAKMKLPTTVNVDELLAGVYAAVLLHETGHALFDILDAPVFGREEDAADQMAAFVALQFGKDTARTAIKGFAYYWYASAIFKADPGALDPKDPNFPTDPTAKCLADAFCGYMDSHGTASQRLYNVLCLAYGGQPDNFQDFVKSGWLPASRVPDCANEYQLVQKAFIKTVYPFIDQAQMAKVKARQWFQPVEMKEK